jgi:hypothetical protein
MKITDETISNLPEKEQELVKALLEDIKEMNIHLPINKKLYLEWIDEHTKYSPERIDPCPDYYGCYIVRKEGITDFLGVEMKLEDLDMALCLLHNFICYHD